MLVHADIFSRNSKDAATRHGIACIHAEVEQHLVELSRITNDRPEIVWND
jgi:hypothetical protein